jgi:hypothetical protein
MCKAIPAFTQDQATHFWSKVKAGERDQCWPYGGGRTARGYGVYAIKSAGRRKRMFMAHRVAFFLSNGFIDNSKDVCHSCDNPPCCNGAHLFLGTALDNLLDASAKGRMLQWKERNPAIIYPERMPRGITHGKAKLTDEQVSDIRKRYSPPMVTVYKLAKEFKVAWQTVDKIVKGKAWRHLLKPPAFGDPAVNE